MNRISLSINMFMAIASSFSEVLDSCVIAPDPDKSRIIITELPDGSVEVSFGIAEAKAAPFNREKQFH